MVAARDRLAKEIEAARAKVAGKVSDEATSDLVGKGEQLRRRWPKLSVEQRRVIIASVVESVTIAPVTRAQNRFDAGRVSVLWRA